MAKFSGTSASEVLDPRVSFKIGQLFFDADVVVDAVLAQQLVEVVLSIAKVQFHCHFDHAEPIQAFNLEIVRRCCQKLQLRFSDVVPLNKIIIDLSN